MDKNKTVSLVFDLMHLHFVLNTATWLLPAAIVPALRRGVNDADLRARLSLDWR